MKPWMWLAATLGLTSCMAGPNYRPQTPEQLRVPEGWHAALPDKAQSGDLSVWWRQLGDPLLSEFVEKALQASPSMDSARARLREARAQRNGDRGKSFPYGRRHRGSEPQSRRRGGLDEL